MTGKPTLLSAAIVLAASPAVATAGERLVLVPFQALSHVRSAREVVMPAVAAALSRRGYEVVSGKRVETALERERIRYLDSLTREQLRTLLGAAGGDAAVLGTILGFAPVGDASIALRVEVTAPEGVLWSRVFGLRMSETAGSLGADKARSIQEVVVRALDRALLTLPHAGRLGRVYLKVPAESAPRAFRAHGFPEGKARVCVLPLVNRTGERGAGMVIETALQHLLEQNPAVEVISPAEMRAAIVAGRIRRLSTLGPENVKALSQALGTSLFVQGTILRYDRNAPEVELYLSLTDLVSGRILWSGLHRRRGADYLGWFRLTAVKDPALLAERVTAELIEAFTRRSTTP